MLARTLVAVMAMVSTIPSGASAQTKPTRPNILLVLFDDAGFMDLGAYGSDTATLNIDKLGPSGVMFTRYYTLPLCGPTCASLMTGQDNHVVGAGTLAEALTPKMRALPAYSMTWRDDQKTIASILKAHGYQMFVIGKWGVCYPFFGDLSFQAVHIPVQVPRAGIDRHNGVFNRGWDVMRKDVA